MTTQRFNADIPKALHKELKQVAVSQDTTMNKIAQEAFRNWLDKQSKK